MPYRIIVDRNRCEANAVCQRIVPQVFQVTEEDELKVLKTDVGDDLLSKVRRAVECCPRAALSIEEA